MKNFVKAMAKCNSSSFNLTICVASFLILDKGHSIIIQQIFCNPFSQIFTVFRYVIICKNLNQLCPTQMAYWAKNHVAILTRAAHLMTY